MPEVLVDRDDAGVATVTLNREHRKNGINKALVDQAIEVFTGLGADHGCRVVVIMGAGTAFCSGMDLSERIEPPLVAKVRSDTNGIYVVDTFVSVLTKTTQAPDSLQSTATYSITIDGKDNWQISDVGGIGAVVGPK
jgi:enoyl-CoA hydratase/carnithine racemase